MKKALTVLAALLIILAVSCDGSTSSSGTSITPPTWLHGSWKVTYPDASTLDAEISMTVTPSDIRITTTVDGISSTGSLMDLGPKEGRMITDHTEGSTYYIHMTEGSTWSRSYFQLNGSTLSYWVENSRSTGKSSEMTLVKQ